MLKNCSQITNAIDIREATAGDYDAITDVMFDAVRSGRSEYTEEQRRAWVPQPRSGIDWNERLESQTIMVAIRAGQIVGFMSLAANGYIDFTFIRPSAQGTGVFRLLYESIEKVAQENGETRLWVHASLMAQPAFDAVGFTITKKETVEIGDQALDRFEMEKQSSIDCSHGRA
jgi:putative acetyltransferase